MIFTPIIYLYVYSMAALGSVLIAARYLMLGIAGLLLVTVPVAMVWKVVTIMLGA
jgi:hypothetical protein